MYQLKMPLKEYEKLKERLLELHPEIVFCNKEERKTGG